MEQLQALLRLDEAILVRVASWRLPSATRVMKTFTRLGDASSWTFLALVLLAIGGTAQLLGLRIAAATLIATVLVQPVKRLCKRSRPSSRGFSALMENPDAFSFPSGHTAAAVAVAVAAAGLGVPLGAVLIGFAICVAASRVYLGAHYPLDVSVGALLGGIAGALTHLFF